MSTKVRIPKMDANMDEGTIGRWMKAEGDPVRKGEPIMELITDKAVFELESPASGTLRRILAPVKSVLPVGYIVALVGSASEPLPDVAEENQRLMEERKAAAGKAGRAAAAQQTRGIAAVGERTRATPAARRLAREKGVALDSVTPTAGVVTRQDVERFLERRS